MNELDLEPDEAEVLRVLDNEANDLDIIRIYDRCQLVDSKPAVAGILRKLVSMALVVSLGTGRYISIKVLETAKAEQKPEPKVVPTARVAAPHVETKVEPEAEAEVEAEDEEGDETPPPKRTPKLPTYGTLRPYSERGVCAFVLFKDQGAALSLDVINTRSGIARDKLSALMSALVTGGYVERVPNIGRGSLYKWAGHFSSPFAKGVIPPDGLPRIPQPDPILVSRVEQVPVHIGPGVSELNEGISHPKLRHDATIEILDRHLSSLMEMSLELQRHRAVLFAQMGEN